LTLATAIVIDRAHHCYLVHISGTVDFQMALYCRDTYKNGGPVSVRKTIWKKFDFAGI